VGHLIQIPGFYWWKKLNSISLLSPKLFHVSCLFMETCMLPCSSERGNDVVIHWFQQSAGNLFVHSFYDGHEQLVVQNQRRTSLFSDQISSGNASLQLTKVEVQDEGRYNCCLSHLAFNKHRGETVKLLEEPHRTS
uniref:Ig-like domain-containing protein n=1 Tax=Neolamprologus brichardi TaxID=32507 RepID=A0A3Q4M8C4_NEOBR